MNVSDLDFDRIADDEFEAARRGEREQLVQLRCRICQKPAGEVLDTAVGPMLVTSKVLGGGLGGLVADLVAVASPDAPRRSRHEFSADDTSFYLIDERAETAEHVGIPPSIDRPGLVHMGPVNTIHVRCRQHGARSAQLTDIVRAIRRARVTATSTKAGA